MDFNRLINDIKIFFGILVSGELKFEPNVVQAGLIVLLLFLLVLTFAQLRKRFMNWHIRGILPGVFMGLLLTLFVEGFLIIGGKTLLTEVLGWENAPKPIANVLDSGRSKLVKVLGVTDEIPESKASEDLNIDELIYYYEKLTDTDKDNLQSVVCEPR